MTDIELPEEQKYEVNADTVCEGGGHWCSGSKSGPGKSWHLVVSRALTDEERTQAQALIDTHRTWDLEDDDYSLPLTWGVLRAVAPDLKILGWWHRPYLIFVKGIYMPPKVYEILNATHYEAAKKKAREMWHASMRELGVPGVRGAISTLRKASDKDLKGMMAAGDRG